MTGFETISLIVSVGGFVGVILSLMFVYMQTRIFARQTEYVARSLSANVAQTINSQVEDITRLFIQYPELRPYFYEGKPIDPVDPHYARTEAIAEFILDTFYTVSVQAVRGVRDAGERAHDPAWRSYVSDCFAQSPIMVQFLRNREAWYNAELIELMNNGLQHTKVAS